MKSLTAHFDPAQPWRANFYRVEGKAEPRKYTAWQATNTSDRIFTCRRGLEPWSSWLSASDRFEHGTERARAM